MKLIKLTGKLAQGRSVMVDDEDFDYLNQFTWSALIRDNHFYARRSWATTENGKQKFHVTLMHRLIMKLHDSKVYVDHIDNDGLNNQKANLRLANNSQNGANRNAKKDGTSNYLGVYKSGKAWMACCQKNGDQCHKRFASEKEAALWYNQKATEYHGNFAKLNIIKNE